MGRPQEITTSGVVLAITGIVLFSAKAVMVKLAYGYGVSSSHLLLFRMLFSFPFYIVIACCYRPTSPEAITPQSYWWIVFFGFIGYYLASLFDFVGLTYIKAGLERIILFIYPTLVLLLSSIFLKIKIKQSQLLAIFITYLGVVVTFLGDTGFGSDHLVYGGVLIFLSALTYAIYLVGSGWLLPKFGILMFTSYAMIVSTICIVVQYLLFDRQSLLHYAWQVYALGSAMAIFSTLIPSFLVSGAIAKMGASNFSIFGSIGPISTILLAYFFLGEQLTSWQFLGTLIVIVGIVVVSRSKQK